MLLLRTSNPAHSLSKPTPLGKPCHRVAKLENYLMIFQANSPLLKLPDCNATQWADSSERPRKQHLSHKMIIYL